jgi:hypothetical protein
MFVLQKNITRNEPAGKAFTPHPHSYWDNLYWDDRVRPPLANILFAPSGPGFSPSGAIHGAFSSRWSAG